MLYVNLASFEPADYARLQEAIDFLETTDLTATPLGRSYQDREHFYCQTLEYETEPIERFDFEIHEGRLDLHYLVEGMEQIDIAPGVDYIAVTGYNGERDIQFVKQPEHFNQIILHQGDLVLIGMHEPHRTNGMAGKQPIHVRKIVLKLGR